MSALFAAIARTILFYGILIFFGPLSLNCGYQKFLISSNDSFLVMS
jgi:hypothetical protein